MTSHLSLPRTPDPHKSTAAAAAAAEAVIELSHEHDENVSRNVSGFGASCATTGEDLLFRGVLLSDLDVGDRLGARRDGGEGFQARVRVSVECQHPSQSK